MPKRFRLRPWHVIAFSLAAGLTVWVLDSLYALFFFRQHLRFMLLNPPETLLDALVTHATPYSLLIRISLLNLFLLAGIAGAQYVIYRRRRESTLRAERDYSVGLIEGSPSFVFGASPEGTITFLNRATSEVLGRPAGELVGLPWWQVFSADHNETAAHIHFQALATGTDMDHKAPLTTPSGEVRIVSWRSIRRPGRRGTGDEIIGFGRDITDSILGERRLRHRLAVEEALAQASRRLVSSEDVDMAGLLRLISLVMDSSHAFILRKIPDGSFETTFVASETRFEDPGWNVRTLQANDMPQWASRVERNEDVVVEDVALLSDVSLSGKGILERFGVNAAAVVPIRSTTGAFLGFLGVADVKGPHAWPEEDRLALRVVAGMVATYWERTEAEERLRQERSLLAQRVGERTAELQAANVELAHAAKLKDEFMATMSHELRTPLNAILGLSESLQEQVFGPLNDRQRKSLATIERSGQHLLQLINDVLDVARIGAGQMTLEMVILSVSAVCNSCVQVIRHDAERKGHRLTVDVDPQVTVLAADERRLKQMLINLLSNAVKFTPAGGSIRLSALGDHDRQMVHFAVTDNGIGISPDDMARLFQPFVQLDSSLARRYEGTGLGLALVQQMAKLHGGQVAVESQVGEGSRFTVSLPWRVTTGANGS